MSEPAAVALHAFCKSGVGQGDTLLIYGIGTIGLIVAQWAKAAGVKNIVLAARTDDKVDFARKLGFDLAVNAEKESLKKLVDGVTKSKGADACIDGTGEPWPWAECIRMVKAGGRVVCMGNPLGDMSLSQDDYWKIFRKQWLALGTAVSVAGKMTGGKLSRQCRING